MTKNIAAGLLMCRVNGNLLEYFLVHPGGPYYRNRDAGVWSLPKGIPASDEPLIETAKREFLEETGITPVPPFHSIGSVTQKGGKVVHAWTFLGQWDPAQGISCNLFTLEWPPRSGKMMEFPEVDRGMWLTYEAAASLINPAQIPLLERARAVYQDRQLANE